MLVSTVLDFQTILFTVGNDLPFVLYLPSYTATAWYHGQLSDDLQSGGLRAALDEAEAFARDVYAPALLQGAALPEDERATVAAGLSRLTGLSVDFLRRADLRVGIMRFTKELLRDRGRTVGRLDSRFTGIDRDAAGETMSYDPSYAVIQGPYTAMLNDYVRRELGFESDLPYEILTDRVRPWKWGEYENRYVNVAETLRDAMSKNPFLRVLFASGYYDLATPYLATEHTATHLGLDPELRANIVLHEYEAGHMMYIHEPSLAAMRGHLTAFLDNATEG
jgi:carboxypeptidase C (cathepsin A)